MNALRAIPAAVALCTAILADDGPDRALIGSMLAELDDDTRTTVVIWAVGYALLTAESRQEWALAAAERLAGPPP